MGRRCRDKLAQQAYEACAASRMWDELKEVMEPSGDSRMDFCLPLCCSPQPVSQWYQLGLLVAEIMSGQIAANQIAAISNLKSSRTICEDEVDHIEGLEISMHE